MTRLRLHLRGGAARFGAAFERALRPGDERLAAERTAEADVIVAALGEPPEVGRRLGRRDGAFHVLVATSADGTLDVSCDALLLEPFDEREAAAVLDAARAALGGRASSISATEGVTAWLHGRAVALEEAVEREERALTEAARPIEVPGDAAFIVLDDEAAFARAVRHVERRGDGRSFVVRAAAPDEASLADVLAPWDVVCRARGGHTLVLLVDAASDHVERVKAHLGATGITPLR